MLAVVSDSSPIIYLTRLDLFPLLRRLHDSIFVPPAVWTEITIGGKGRTEGKNLESAVAEGWIAVKAPALPSSIIANHADLGLGEVEAILLAKELEAVLLTDDAEARSAAERIGVRVSGTLGVLVRLKADGHVSAVKPLLEALRGTNFHISDALYIRALSAANERP